VQHEKSIQAAIHPSRHQGGYPPSIEFLSPPLKINRNRLNPSLFQEF
jgi:hypothetical protein